MSWPNISGTGPFQLDFFSSVSLSVVDWLVCLCSLSCCMTPFWPNFSRQIDGLTFDSSMLLYTEELYINSVTSRWPGSVTTRQVQVSTPPHVWFLSNVVANHLYFGLMLAKDIVPEVLFLQMQFCKPTQWWHLLFRKEELFHAKPSKQALHVHVFLIVLSWTFRMLTDTLWVSGIFSFSEHWKVWPWVLGLLLEHCGTPECLKLKNFLFSFH